MKSLIRVIVFLFIITSSNASLSEELPSNPRKDKDSVFSITHENDFFAGEDEGYTSGVKMSVLSSENDTPAWIKNTANFFPFMARAGHKRYGVAFGQILYAPGDLTKSQLIKDDRPYAAYLYGGVGLISDLGYRIDNMQFSIGMVGPSALGKQTQKFVHKNIAGVYPRGWDNQLKDELGLELSYERKWRALYEFSPFGYGFDATPHIGMSLGNVHTHASTGVTFRFGYDLPADYGPPLIRPNLPGSDFFHPHTSGIGWYVFTGFEGRAVARDIFLDGNTFKKSHHVDKKHFIGGIQSGIALTYESIRLAYIHNFRTKEFKQQRNADEFGALTLSVRF